MPAIDSIELALQKTGWNKARVRLLARFLVAVITCRSVCLYRLANLLPGDVKTSSHFRRLQRFVADFEMDFAAFAAVVIALCGLRPPFVLALDRTNWRLGKAEMNVLLLALVYNGVAFPVFWKVLGKSGNSNLAERKALLERFLSVFGRDSIAYLLADREFGGRAFAGWLKEERIGFVLRLRGNVKMSNACGQERTARGLFWHRKMHESIVLGRRQVFGGKPLCLFVAGMRLSGGDFVIVVSDTGEALLERYGRRWGIETLFGCLKKRGFDLEGTHLTRPERLERLLAVLALAFCWAYVSGAWLYEQKPWKVKKHGRLTLSLFRAGLDWLQRLFLPLCGSMSQGEFNKAVRFLSCT
jgi:hypothetical protein